ncbi:MAG: serine hydrolase [Legionellaceae bacterium]|nr:serine hydrolase [Legionellaceae bacterium]
MKKIFTTMALFCSLSYAAILTAKPTNAATTDQTLKNLLAEFEQYAENARLQWNVPGMAIAIVKNDQLIYKKGFGVKKLGESGLVDPHTVFQIGSLTKAFTVAITAQLIDQGKLDWQDRVIDHYPSFIMYDPYVTREFRVQDLYAQHSGLQTFAGDLQYVLGYDANHIVYHLRDIEPTTSFRSTYSYLNSLFVVGAKLNEKITNISWENLLQENIFNPLEMKESSVGLKKYLQNKNIAGLHLLLNNKITTIPYDNLLTEGIYTSNGPAGGINSNVIDMSKWLIMQLNEGSFKNKQIISKENINIMHAPQTLTGKFLDGWSSYALGWSYADGLSEPLISHNGETAGAKAMILLAPKSKVGIVILTNDRDTLLPEALAYQFIDKYLGNTEADWSKLYLDGYAKITQHEKSQIQASLKVVNYQKALPLTVYTGIYNNKIYGDAKIVHQQNQLTFIIGPKHIAIPLQHLTGNIFILKSPPELLGVFDTIDNPQVIFNVTADGKVADIDIPLFAADSIGKFIKK